MYKLIGTYSDFQLPGLLLAVFRWKFQALVMSFSQPLVSDVRPKSNANKYCTLQKYFYS